MGLGICCAFGYLDPQINEHVQTAVVCATFRHPGGFVLLYTLGSLTEGSSLRYRSLASVLELAPLNSTTGTRDP